MTAAAELAMAVTAQLVLLSIGAAVLWSLCGAPRAANAPLWAAAYPLGALSATCAMAIAGLAGVPWRLPWLALGAAALIATLAVARRRGLVALAGVPRRDVVRDLPVLPGPVRVGLALLLAAKVVFVLAEIVRRPLSGWDSFAVWALRAKVWADRGGPVLDGGDPFFYGGAARPDYPPHASLLQTWTALWMGEWHDVLVNLPWAFYYLSLLAVCFAAVARHLSRDWALAATFALAGLPLLVVHAALAGYADLLLATHFLFAVVLVHEAASPAASRPLRVAAAVVALTPALIKLEGVPLAASCLIVLAARSLGAAPRRRRWFVVGLVVALAVVAAVANPTLREFLSSSSLRPQGTRALFDGLFRAGNWHFLWVAFVVTAVGRGRALWGRPLGWLLLNVLTAIAPLLFALLFTGAAAFAQARSADSRLFLGVAPAALLFVALALGDACRRAAVPDAAAEAGPPAASRDAV